MFYFEAQNSLNTRHYKSFTYKDLSFVPHMHRDFEAIYVAYGEVCVAAAGESAAVREGEMALILSGQIHSYSTPDSSSMNVFLFSGDLVSELARQVNGMSCHIQAFAPDELTKRIILSAASRGAELGALAVRSALYAIGDCFTRNVTLFPASDSLNNITCRMFEYIETHYMENLTLDGLSRALSYESHYLSRCFSRNAGMNFRAYVNALRLQKACRRIADTDDSITEIAFGSGFQSIRSFNGAFQAAFGTSPTSYRAQAFMRR